MKKKILLLGPRWRNKKIEKVLKKKNHVYLTNKKINFSIIKKKINTPAQNRTGDLPRVRRTS